MPCYTAWIVIPVALFRSTFPLPPSPSDRSIDRTTRYRTVSPSNGYKPPRSLSMFSLCRYQGKWRSYAFLPSFLPSFFDRYPSFLSQLSRNLGSLLLKFVTLSSFFADRSQRGGFSLFPMARKSIYEIIFYNSLLSSRRCPWNKVKKSNKTVIHMHNTTQQPLMKPRNLSNLALGD